MAYQVLARLWRPHHFDDVVGQDYAVRALSYALNHKKLHSAYLLTGSHGIGKTSLARIIARAINCEQGVSAKPCDTCGACVSMLAGRAVDVIEIDAASRTKVEDTRELLDQVQYAPTISPYKIYIIDEVHMLSTHSFNALLKTLEEPPAHVLFLLATTHPDKLPVTVRSRCLQFHLRPILSPDIEKQLTGIITAEKIIAEPAALTAIAKAARGSMRDALSLLDQAIAVGQGEVKLIEVNAMLGLASTDLLNTLVDGLLACDMDLLIQTVRQHSQSMTTLPLQLLALLQQAALYQFSPASIDSHDEQSFLAIRLAKTLSQETLQLYYQLSLHAIDDVTKAPTPLLAVEMWLLRLVHFEIAPKASISTMTEASPKTTHHRPAEHPHVTITPPLPQAVPPMKAAESPKATATQTADPSVQYPAWSVLLPQLGLTGVVRILAEQADVQWTHHDTATLILAKNQSGMCQPSHIEAIAAALSTYCHQTVKLTLQLVDTPVDSPAILAMQHAKQQQQAVLTELQTDPKIQAFVKEFDATIGPVTFLPST